MSNDQKKDKQKSFEEALNRLELVVRDMEGGELSLDDMMKHFDEGSDLVKYCNKKLNEVERKIEKLVKDGETISTEEFDEPKE